MMERDLKELTQLVQAGKLSRNKHFDAYRDPDVREARRGAARLQTVAELLRRHREDPNEVRVARLAAKRGLHLEIHVRTVDVVWNTYLREHEHDLLREDDELDLILQRITTLTR